MGRRVEAIIEKNNRVVAVIADGHRVNCTHLILSPEFAPSSFGEQSNAEIQRTILIADGSVCSGEKEHITLLSLPEIAPESAPRLFEAGFECCQSPKGYFVAQITSRKTSEEYVDALIEKIYGKGEGGDARPRKLWSLYFTMRSAPFEMKQSAPENVAVPSPPNESLDYANVIQEAKDVFTKFWPDHDFLPRSLKSNEDEERENFEEQHSTEQEKSADTQKVIEE